MCLDTQLYSKRPLHFYYLQDFQQGIGSWNDLNREESLLIGIIISKNSFTHIFEILPLSPTS